MRSASCPKLGFLPITQAENGRDAKGPTAQEFADVIRKLKPKAEGIIKNHAHMLYYPIDAQPIYSFDNPNIHKKAAADLLDDFIFCTDDFTEGNVFPLPKYAGDMHKVIEHIHGILTNKMRHFLTRVRKRWSVEVYRSTLQSFFWSIKADSVQRDVMTLLDTYDIISRPVSGGGTGGDWAPRPYN